MLLPGSSDASSVLAKITALAIKVALLLGLPRTAVATTTAATGLTADMPLPVPQLVLPPGNSKLLPAVLLLLLLLLLPPDMDMEHTPLMPILPAWQLLVWPLHHHPRVCLLWVAMVVLVALHLPLLLVMGLLLHLPATSPHPRLPLREQFSSSVDP
jgi:hypothetical protein